MPEQLARRKTTWRLAGGGALHDGRLAAGRQPADDRPRRGGRRRLRVAGVRIRRLTRKEAGELPSRDRTCRRPDQRQMPRGCIDPEKIDMARPPTSFLWPTGIGLGGSMLELSRCLPDMRPSMTPRELSITAARFVRETAVPLTFHSSWGQRVGKFTAPLRGRIDVFERAAQPSQRGAAVDAFWAGEGTDDVEVFARVKRQQQLRSARRRDRGGVGRPPNGRCDFTSIKNASIDPSWTETPAAVRGARRCPDSRGSRGRERSGSTGRRRS